jgi:hypothetical protein
MEQTPVETSITDVFSESLYLVYYYWVLIGGITDLCLHKL